MAQPDDEKKALGRRLASARTLAGYTLEGAAKALTERGHKISKAGIGHWETGHNLPDALWLRRLAKLYCSTLDALVWDDAITMEAIQFAAQYDGLNEKQKRMFKTLWLAYFQQAASDADVGEHLPTLPRTHESDRK